MSVIINLGLLAIGLLFWPFVFFLMQRFNARPVRPNRNQIIRNLDGFIMTTIIAIVGAVFLTGFGILCIITTNR